MSRRLALARLSDLASEQWGMVTTAQARRLGVSSVDLARLASDGILVPAADAARVYRVAGAPADPELDSLRAAWLQLGGSLTWQERYHEMDAVVSHRSAAQLRRFGDIIPRAHEFYVTSRRQLRRDDLRLRVRREIPRSEWEIVDGLPASRGSRIVADLLADHEDESAVAQICVDATRSGLLTRRRLVDIVAPYAPAYGHRSAEEMTSVLLGGTDRTQV